MAHILPKVVAVIGPTASGKTNLSLSLAKKFNGEVVSADSRQIYKELDIATDKIEGKKSKEGPYDVIISHGVIHYMLGIIWPDEQFSVADYKKMAESIIDYILSKNRLPLLVGGSMLYTQSVIDNYNFDIIKKDDNLRARLNKELETKGLDFLVKKLSNINSDIVSQIDIKNPRRVIRALERAFLSREFTKDLSLKKLQPKYEFLLLAKKFNKDDLKKKIELRIEDYFRRGLINEVQNLIKKYGKYAPWVDTIGYREVVFYLENKISIEEAKDLIKRNTWKYVKRQMTWYKKDKRINWISADKQAFALVEKFLRK